VEAIVEETRERAERAGAKGSTATGLALLTAAADEAEPRDRSTAAVLLAEGVLFARMAYGPDRALELAQRAASLSSAVDGDHLLVVRWSLGNALQWSGRYDAARAEWEAAAAIIPTPSAHLLSRRADALLRSGHLQRAMEGAYAAVAKAESTGDRIAHRDSLTARALAEIHLGLLREAHASGIALLAQAEERTGDHVEALGLLAWVEALLGDEPTVRARVHEAGDVLSELSFTPSGGMALGLLELARARYDLAVDHLETKLRGLAPIAALLSVRPFLDALVEACVRSGRRERATDLLTEVFHRSVATEQPRYVAVAHRVKALVDESTADYEASLEHHRAWGNGFEEARTRLLYGELLRRKKQKQEARRHLAASVAGFELVGAALWEQRARDELRAAGARPARTPTGVRLTPQEERVAQLVAEGLSNKEIAGRLVVSPKTVEGHLRNIFEKLGATSRTQVARMMPH